MWWPAHLVATAPGLLEALRDARTHMLGLLSYLATCSTDVIVENLETTIAVLRKKVECCDTAIRKAKEGK